MNIKMNSHAAAPTTYPYTGYAFVGVITVCY